MAAIEKDARQAGFGLLAGRAACRD
jgi:hypothetical protein